MVRSNREPVDAGRRRIKTCGVCGREIEWRRKWRNDWDHVKYCSEKCRRNGLKPIDRRLEKAILELLGDRASGASICPSEAARRLRPPDAEDSWRELMQPVRNAARRLAASNRIVFLQAGRPVDPSRAKGPVRLKLATGNPAGGDR
ncbi:MAG TPA: DUF3253 domain-containing protein [Desulfobacterales bacterium]